MSTPTELMPTTIQTRLDTRRFGPHSAAPQVIRHALDLVRVARKLEIPEVRADLASIGIEDPLKFLAHVVLAGDEVAAFAGDGPFVTDDHTVLDFSVARSKESSFGIGNQASGNWLIEYMAPGAGGDFVAAAFFRRVNELAAHKRPVAPHLANVEAAGYDRDEVSARIEGFARRQVR